VEESLALLLPQYRLCLFDERRQKARDTLLTRMTKGNPCAEQIDTLFAVKLAVTIKIFSQNRNFISVAKISP